MVKVRIAPSPTGAFHIGNAQSALYNWLFARANNGKFFVRIEDTDKARSTKESEDNIISALTWLGLKPDADPVRQSENLAKHKKMLEKLISEKKAFYCHHGQEELENERRQQEEAKEPPRHICEHKHTEQGRKTGGIIRLSVNNDSDRIIAFNDQIRGKIEFKASLLGDFSIARSLDDPLYNFAVVADDSDMEITHVIRGEDHISNTPKQILIYEALGLPVPAFAHLPLILGADRSKLSKRHGGTATLDYKKDFLPEAIINFLGALSYTFSKEMLTKEEMSKEFDLGKVHRSGAIFDLKKLHWLNSQWIRTLSPDEFKKILDLPDLPDEAVPLITERLEKLTDVQDFDYFWKEPSFAKASEGRPESSSIELLKWKKADLNKSLEILKKVEELLKDFDFAAGKDALRKILDNLASEIGDRGLVYWPLRVALSGKEKSPDPVDIAFVIGKEKVIERINRALGF